MSTPMVGLKGSVPATVYVTFSESTSTVAGTVVTGTMYPFGYRGTGMTALTIPKDEIWHLVKCHSAGVVTNGADGELFFTIDGIDQPPFRILSTTNTSLNQAQIIIDPSIPLPGGSTVSINLRLYATPSGTVTQALYLEFRRYKVA